jgi:maleylacetate reductase
VKPFTRQALPGRVVFGAGGLEQLPDEVARLGAQRPLLIADGVAAPVERLQKLLPDAVGTWDEIRQHVPAELSARCASFAQAHGADLLVSVGGGSATGLAKAVALHGGPPILAVPTTLAGSEMTPVWGESDGGVKKTGRDPRVQPVTVIYDPELLSSLPTAILGPSGMNALAHCVEALYAVGAEPLSSLAAIEGARLLLARLPQAYTAPDVEVRGEVQWASCLAGNVFGTVGSSLHHSLCHLLGGMHDLPHAEMHAVVLPHVVEFLLPAVRSQLEPLAAVVGVPIEELPGALWDCGAHVGTPHGLRAIGLDPSEAPAVAAALLERQPPSPVTLTLDNARALIEAATYGDRPMAATKGQP